MPALDRLPEASREAMLSLSVQVNDGAPFHRLGRPLSEARVAIVTSAGIHLRDDRPFVPSDPTYRRIPSSARGDELLQSHASIGFDRTAVMADVNVVFPLDRLREMVAEHRIGSLGPTFYSFMGAQRDPSAIAATTAPEVAQQLLADGVDVVLLTPT
jgi:D-proline reductase (dithiol) PrdB